MTGKTVTLARVRDTPLTLTDGGAWWVIVHPSYLLRLPGERARFVDVLKRIRDRAAALVEAN